MTIERRIGGEDAADLGIQCVMARFNLEDGYPEEPERAASELVQDIEGALADPLRRDVRNRFAFTIDPVDARDFDDAISIERMSAGGFSSACTSRTCRTTLRGEAPSILKRGAAARRCISPTACCPCFPSGCATTSARFGPMRTGLP